MPLEKMSPVMPLGSTISTMPSERRSPMMPLEMMSPVMPSERKSPMKRSSQDDLSVNSLPSTGTYCFSTPARKVLNACMVVLYSTYVLTKMTLRITGTVLRECGTLGYQLCESVVRLCNVIEEEFTEARNSVRLELLWEVS